MTATILGIGLRKTDKHHILVPRKMIEYIAHNFIITTHARFRILQRSTRNDIRRMILNSPLAWRNTDGTINIAIDYYHYIVVGEVDGKFKIITYQGRSYNGYSVVDKFVIAYRGIDRKENDFEKENKLT